MTIDLPELSLVVLVGPSGSGKSTFARTHFRPTEVLSSDVFRGLVSDSENDQNATPAAFEALHFIAAKRLAAGRLTVIDATNVQSESRNALLRLAREYHVLPVVIVLNLPPKVCHERNAGRPDRTFGPHVVRQQAHQLRASLRGLEREGFRTVHVLSSVEQIDAVQITRRRMWTDRRDDHGPFDIVGDVHGCRSELVTLLERLGYDVDAATHPEGRRVIFLGDLVDRGPDAPGALAIAMRFVEAGRALCVPGNHEAKLLRKLRGKDIKLTHGLAQTVEQLALQPPEFSVRAERFIDSLVSHFVLDDGKLVVAHAGMKEAYQGRASGTVRAFALYGETTGETDDFGLPVRFDWASEYRGKAMVVYGHTPVQEAEWLNNTIDIDTGCVFGGKLTALRYPERQLVSVPAEQTWWETKLPLRPTLPGRTPQQLNDDLLDLSEVQGKRVVETHLMRAVTVREENAAAALEAMSRFSADPRWLITLPPTMSPCETAADGPLLEHPAQAFAYYRNEGVLSVICEQKHMGSRALLVVCRDEDAARTRFGVSDGTTGLVYTRTGRRFFEDKSTEDELLARVRAAIGRAGLWDELSTDWMCLDAELMPWSAKAQELLKTQYAAVGAASTAALTDSVALLTRAATHGAEVAELLARYEGRAALAHQYIEAWRRYCWPVTGVGELRLAPFHLLASEGKTHVDQDHPWHLSMLARLVDPEEPLLVATSHVLVDLTSADSEAAGIAWWEALTEQGGEGMVVKPLSFIARGKRGYAQPAIKCRGQEYLRIIYGPEYTQPEHLSRLRARGVSTKRSLALREFALGIEALERFVRREPLRRVHECVFAVLALESEPVDPRL
jgi:protein phosphatase